MLTTLLGLDPAGRLTIWDEVRRINGRGTTVSAGLIFVPLLFLTPNFVPRDLLTHPWRSRRR